MKRLTALLMLLVGGAAEAQNIEMRPTPCRLFDSRNIGGAGLGPKVDEATILTRGDAGSAQGGESDCGVPATASGAVLNLVVFQPESTGWARLWGYGRPEPLSTSINGSMGASSSTGLTVKLGDDGKLSLSASITAAHYIVDLAGYIDGGGGLGAEAPRVRRFLSIANAPFAPSAVTAGDRFVVAPTNTVGVFVGHEDEWVVWDGSDWVFEAARDGDLGYTSAEGVYYRYKGSGTPEWRAMSMSSVPME